MSRSAPPTRHVVSASMACLIACACSCIVDETPASSMDTSSSEATDVDDSDADQGTDAESTDTTTTVTAATATTGGDAESTDADGSGGWSGELGPCGGFRDCIDATDGAITAFLSVYGPEGSCWTEFTAEECWQDCRALFDAQASHCPSIGTCCECSSVEDCAYLPAFDLCEDNRCASSVDLAGCELLENCPGDSLGLAVLRNLCLPGELCQPELEGLAACLFADDASGACTALEECGQTFEECGAERGCAAEGTAFSDCIVVPPDR